jgi:hypothetical protein
MKLAYSSHIFCFICGRDYGLRLVKKESIKLILQKFNIFVKYGTRCCILHLNEFGFVVKDFELIRYRDPRKYVKISTELLTYITTFDDLFLPFKNFNSLEETHCKHITGWTKEKLYLFTSYLTSINNNKNRSKYELVAFYRYWLKKGLDQETFSKFKKNSKQQHFSRYLSQARISIYKDFVPFFLGAASRTRDFFLQHNTDSVNELFRLVDTLAIVVDGTYIRIEKSFNNEFQYKTYSEQKKQNLLKPFLITCADGYIVDCHVPFAANKNDANIFREILNGDQELRNILLKDKTIVFLDRGYFINMYIYF